MTTGSPESLGTGLAARPASLGASCTPSAAGLPCAWQAGGDEDWGGGLGAREGGGRGPGGPRPRRPIGAGHPLGCVSRAGSGAQASVPCPVTATGGELGLRPGARAQASPPGFSVLESHVTACGMLWLSVAPPPPRSPTALALTTNPVSTRCSEKTSPGTHQVPPASPPPTDPPPFPPEPSDRRTAGGEAPDLLCYLLFFSSFNSRNNLPAKKWGFSCGAGAVSENELQG